MVVPTLFVSTACLPDVTGLSDKLRLYANVGVYNVELGAYVGAGQEVLDSPGETQHRFLVHNYFAGDDQSFVLNLASPDKEVRRRSIGYAVEAIRLSKRLGAPLYSVHAGFITDPIGFDGSSFVFPSPQSPRDRLAAFERFAESVSDVIAATADTNVQVLIENNIETAANAGKLLFATPEDCDQMVSIAAGHRLGILLDTGHLKVSATTHGFSPSDFLDSIRPHVVSLHLHTNDGIADEHRPINSSGWPIDLLDRPPESCRAVVIEGKFHSAEALGRHARWAMDRLERHAAR